MTGQGFAGRWDGFVFRSDGRAEWLPASIISYDLPSIQAHAGGALADDFIETLENALDRWDRSEMSFNDSTFQGTVTDCPENNRSDNISCVHVGTLTGNTVARVYRNKSPKSAPRNWTDPDDEITILAQDIRFRSNVKWRLDNGQITSPSGPQSVDYANLQRIATHEFGHYMGVNHHFYGCYRNDVMWADARTLADSHPSASMTFTGKMGRIIYPGLSFQHPQEPEDWKCSSLIDNGPCQ